MFAAMIMMASGVAAHAEQTDYDPTKVSDSLKAIFQFGSASTTKALNANTVTLLTGTIGGTYAQFGADLASVLDDGGNLRVLPIIGRGSVQSVADVLFLKGVDLGIVRADTLDYLERATSTPSSWSAVSRTCLSPPSTMTAAFISLRWTIRSPCRAIICRRR
jgi:TRAP-type uncharacterized transport system substrate-binding protein